MGIKKQNPQTMAHGTQDGLNYAYNKKTKLEKTIISKI